MAAKTTKRAVTQEDLDLNPELVEQGVEIGTMMKLPPLPEKEESIEEDEDSEEGEKEPSDSEEVAPEESSETTVGKVTFHLRDKNVKGGIATRAFDHHTHGKNFKDLADMFEETNKDHIIKRVDE